MSGRTRLSTRALRVGRARRKGSGSARAMALALLFLLQPWMTRAGLPRGRFGFCIIWPRRAMCGRRLRGWGCRGSRLMCCGGGIPLLRSGGRRPWGWRGGMSRKCWRRGRSTGWRSRSFTMASRWRCGGAMTRGCCWRIWRGWTGRRRAVWPSGSMKCWRWSRGRGRWSWCRFRRSCCLRCGRFMPRRRGPCFRMRRTGRGSWPWRRARRGRRTSLKRAWRSGGRWRRGTGTAGVGARRARSMRWWRRLAGTCRRWSSSRWAGGAGFCALDRVNRVNLLRAGPVICNSAGNPMRGAMLSWVKVGAVLPPPPPLPRRPSLFQRFARVIRLR